MKWISILRTHPGRSAGIMAGILLILGISVILASLLAQPGDVFHIVDDEAGVLPEDQDIAAWASFDKDSYQIGEIVRQQLRILYRSENVIPDLDSLRRRMSFFPLEQRKVLESVTTLPGGLTEYTLNYELQAVRVDLQQSYRIDPFILYYTSTDQTNDEIYSQTIRTPAVHIGAYYPNDLERVDLLPAMGMLATAESLRRNILILTGFALFFLAAYLLWEFGRRRPLDELAQEEQLWRAFMSMEHARLDNRTALLNYEQIFTRLLDVQQGISPEAFWAETDPEDEEWRAITVEARQLLLENYQVTEPDDAEVIKMKNLLGEKLSSLVAEARLKIEQQPGFIKRISMQPGLIARASILSGLALSVLIFCLFPDKWLSSELRDYNDLIGSLSDSDTIGEATYLALSAMGDQATNEVVKFPALYNAGTLRTDNSFSMATREWEILILNTVIRSNTVEQLFMELLEDGPFDEESQIVSILVNGAEQLRRAQLDLRAAVRVNPIDEHARRNLEITIKRRELVVTKLQQIRRFYREQSEGEEEALSDEGIINLLESSLPEDPDEDLSAGKNDRGYMILERF